MRFIPQPHERRILVKKVNTTLVLNCCKTFVHGKLHAVQNHSQSLRASTCVIDVRMYFFFYFLGFVVGFCEDKH